jgi:hypothetical protein
MAESKKFFEKTEEFAAKVFSTYNILAKEETAVKGNE